MRSLTLDFETYFDAEFSLRKMAIPEFVADPRFRIHGIALRHPDGRVEFRTDAEAALKELQSAYGERLERIATLMHNSYFDAYVLHDHFGIYVAYPVDTMLLAYHAHGRKGKGGGADGSLAGLAKRYGLQPKGDLDFMCGVRNPDAKQTADLAEYACADVEITHELSRILLPKVSRPEVELPLMAHTLHLFAERRITVDEPTLYRLAGQVRADLDRALKEASISAKDASGDKVFAERFADALSATGRSLPMKLGKNGPIPATAKGDEAMQALAEDANPAVRALARARLSKKSADQVQAKIGTLRRIAEATGGFLPPHLVYFGGHTGRFAGGGRFNIQNLGRDGCGLAIRHALLPKPGRVFVVADYAQIEARVLAWLAGQKDLLADFANGVDVYSEFASATLGREVRKPVEGDSEEDRARLTALRTVGKRSVLGLGYQMGALRFLESLKSDPLASPLFGAGVLSPLACREIVGAYRDRYTSIPAFWCDLDGAFRCAMDGAECTVGRINFLRDGADVLVKLPSGRMLRYANPRQDHAPRSIAYLDDNGEEAKFDPDDPGVVYGSVGTSLYGGKLCENLVQAAARDLLAEAVLAIEAAGREVLFHVHDEVVVETPAEQSEAALGEVKTIMETGPAWAEGLPVEVEAKVTQRYGK